MIFMNPCRKSAGFVHFNQMFLNNNKKRPRQNRKRKRYNEICAAPAAFSEKKRRTRTLIYEQLAAIWKISHLDLRSTRGFHAFRALATSCRLRHRVACEIAKNAEEDGPKNRPLMWYCYKIDLGKIAK